jgi:hypothetical protein
MHHFSSNPRYIKRIAIAIYLVVASLCFLSGLVSHKLRITFSPKVENEITCIEHISVCDLVSDPTRYNGKTFSVKGMLTANRSGSVYHKSALLIT